jgi:predicted O-linked N-acetylglucosamine transferase (SPINDLY family)
LSDPYFDPEGLEERFYSERTFRLAHSYWCYEPPSNAPEVGPAPALANGYVTFGCLNNLAKLSEPALAAWGRILNQVPDSRLVLHGAEGKHRGRIIDSLQNLGIKAERVRFVGFVPFGQFLALHQQLDIALDPFPYGGGTTSCDALWMGVPVVSLRGATAVGRGGASILGNLGASELLADTVNGYVERAVALARDCDRIQHYRSSLRQRMLASPLTDSALCTTDLEAAYRRAWTDWCGGEGTE